MKSKIFLIVISLTIVSVLEMKAQMPAPGTYIANDKIDKFVGVWKGNVGTDTVIIELKKVKIPYPAPLNFLEDMILGCHTFVSNGAIIESSSQYINSTDFSKYSIIGNIDSYDTTQTNLDLADITKRKSLDLSLQFVLGLPNRLVWHTEFKEMCFKCLPGMTLPKDMVLYKQ